MTTITETKIDNVKEEIKSEQKNYKLDIKWSNVVLFSILHVGAVYGAHCYIVYALLSTLIYTQFIAVLFGEYFFIYFSCYILFISSQ